MTDTIKTSWNKFRTLDNAEIKTMTSEQHRAVSMLALYRFKFQGQRDYFDNGSYSSVRYFEKFFLNSLPVMLRSVCLPALDLSCEFYDGLGWDAINTKIIKYLDYIDRKFGTWYAPLSYVA